jgi:cytoskeletal protein RodZ
MAEVAPVGPSGANRAFLIIVLGLAAVLVIGLIGAGALFLLPALLTPKPVSAVASITPTRVAILAATATQAAPAATATSVVVAQANTDTPAATEASTATATAAATATSPAATPAPPTGTAPAATAVPGPTPASGKGLPQTGLGEDLLVLGAGLVLVVVMFAARRARA